LTIFFQWFDMGKVNLRTFFQAFMRALEMPVVAVEQSLVHAHIDTTE
jgi:hypothetical protein